MSRKVSESLKKRVAGKQSFKCANKPNIRLSGLDNYQCPLWKINSENRGSFDESGYEIDHIVEHCVSKNDSEENLQALCKLCHTVKTKLFLSNRNKKKKLPQKETINNKLKSYLEQLTSSQLQHICRIVVVNWGGSKEKMITRILNNGCKSVSKIQNEIDTHSGEKYMLRCMDGHVLYTNKTIRDYFDEYQEMKKENNTHVKARCDECDDDNIFCQFDNAFYNNVKDNDNLSDYLVLLNMARLKQLCMLFNLSSAGNKNKLVKKLVKNNICQDDIISKINTKDKYLIECYGIEKCDNCKIKNGIVMYCDDCLDKKEDIHIYHTDTKLSNDKESLINDHIKIRDGKTKCRKCNKICYMQEYQNAFYEHPKNVIKHNKQFDMIGLFFDDYLEKTKENDKRYIITIGNLYSGFKDWYKNNFDNSCPNADIFKKHIKKLPTYDSVDNILKYYKIKRNDISDILSDII